MEEEAAGGVDKEVHDGETLPTEGVRKGAHDGPSDARGAEADDDEGLDLPPRVAVLCIDVVEVRALEPISEGGEEVDAQVPQLEHAEPAGYLSSRGKR